MKTAARFDSGRFKAGRFGGHEHGTGEADFSVSVLGLSENDTHGPTAQIGVPLVASISGDPASVPNEVSWQWHDSDGPIADATGRAFSPTRQSDGKDIYVVATPNDGRAPQLSGIHTVRHAAPVATGSINDQAMDAASGTNTITGNIRNKFSGKDLTFQVSGYAGAFLANTALRIDASNGATDTWVTVEATNSGGLARLAFRVTITAT